MHAGWELTCRARGCSYANYPNLGTAETYEPAKRVVRSRCGLPLAIPYLVMFTKGPLHVPITPGSVVGGVAWGLRNGFDVAPRGARAPRAWPRARPFPVTARFGHPLLEHRFPSHLYRIRSLGKSGEQLVQLLVGMVLCLECYASVINPLKK